MNNNDLRRLIWSYLRKKPKIACFKCNDVCVWDKKRIKQYYYLSTRIQSGDLTNIYYCKECWIESVPNLEPSFNCMIT